MRLASVTRNQNILYTTGFYIVGRYCINNDADVKPFMHIIVCVYMYTHYKILNMKCIPPQANIINGDMSLYGSGLVCQGPRVLGSDSQRYT